VMRPLILLLTLSLLALSCASAAPPTESVARTEQALCVGPPGLQATGLVLTPATVQRANFLVNKMWGAWPKSPATCPAAWYCGAIVPNACTQGQCDAGQCPGWTCRMTAINFADDGLRLSTAVAGLTYIDAKFSAQPDAAGLTALEATELGVARASAALLTDYWCGQ
jgi:hypothetical protein